MAPAVDRYAELRTGLEHLGRQVDAAEELHRSCAPANDAEAEVLSTVALLGLAVSVMATELEIGADLAHTQLRARIAVATQAALAAKGAIHTPMDGPLAKVHVAAELLTQAMEEGL